MTYDVLRKTANRGWNTWFSPSMTTHALLPYGFAIGLCFRDYADVRLVRNLKVGDCGLRPGSRSWDGAYTSLTFRLGRTEVTVESTAREGEQYILVTPSGDPVRAPAMIVEASLLWGKEGTVFKREG